MMKILNILQKKEYVNASCGTNKGRTREINEDNYYFAGRIRDISEHDIKGTTLITESIEVSASGEELFAIFDGIGGTENGELASFCAADETKKFMYKHKKNDYRSTEEMLNVLSQELNQKVYECGFAQGTSSMGTTFVAMCFSKERVWSCNVGDSRCYRFRNGVLKMMSEDHDENMFATRRKERKAKLIQYLGMNPKDGLIEPFVASSDRKKGDIFLICSDGLTDMVSEPDIADVLKNSDCTERAAQGLIELALKNGGKDNVSIIVCE